MYATEAIIVRGAGRGRMQALMTSLRDYGCVARVEWERRAIVLEVPDDDVAWILTGGLAELLGAYADCVHWRPIFRERSARRASLPKPGDAAAGLSPAR